MIGAVMKHSMNHLMDGWYEAMRHNPAWRPGQAFFNVLRDYDPSTAEALRVSTANPFYDDDKVSAAIQFVDEYYN
jgi:hypothetical protein